MSVSILFLSKFLVFNMKFIKVKETDIFFSYFSILKYKLISALKWWINVGFRLKLDAFCCKEVPDKKNFQQ